MLPSPANKEWLQLVTGVFEPRLSSHLLKIKLHTLRQKVKRKMMTPAAAARELYDDCAVHEDIYRKDLHTIFQKEKKESP